MGAPDPTSLLLDLRGDVRPDETGLDPLIYRELRRIAGALMRRERNTHTLQPTALAHEAYIRLIDQSRVGAEDRGRFLAIAGRSMRQILVSHARRRAAKKRGGGARRLTLVEPEAAEDQPMLDLLALDDALTELSALDGRMSRVVELRFFAGLTIHETAGVLGVSTSSVENYWAMARAWLEGRLT